MVNLSTNCTPKISKQELKIEKVENQVELPFLKIELSEPLDDDFLQTLREEYSWSNITKKDFDFVKYFNFLQEVSEDLYDWNDEEFVGEADGSNRYPDIFPYEENAFPLPEDGYINASCIKMSDGQTYIAAQCPKPGYLKPFFEMIDRSGTDCILNLTSDKDSNFYPYWESEEVESITWSDPVDIQGIAKLYTCELNGKTIKMLRYNWVDQKGANPRELLQLINLVKVHHTKDPLVVHCSAGIGRTGTFIVANTSGNQTLGEKVLEMRGQRKYSITQPAQLKTIAKVWDLQQATFNLSVSLLPQKRRIEQLSSK